MEEKAKADRRDEKGQFIKGHKGGPGRPKKKREERFFEITLSACSFKDWREIVKKAVELAKRGDARARSWLSDYLLGVPPQRHEFTGAGGEPIGVKFDDSPSNIAAVLGILAEIGIILPRAEESGDAETDEIHSPATDA